MSVTPERDDHNMTDVPTDHVIHSLLPGRRHRVYTPPPTCTACAIPTDRVAPGTPIPACGYHGGVPREDAR